MKVGLRIYYWDGTTHAHGSYYDFTDTLTSYVDFYDEEVEAFRIVPNFATTLVETNLTKPKLISLRPATWSGLSASNIGHKFEMQIRITKPSTKTRLDTILANYWIWKIHPLPVRSLATYYYAVIDPNYVYEYFGSELASQVVTITGYETSNKNFYHTYDNATAPTHVLARKYKQSPFIKIYYGDPPEASLTELIDLINTDLSVKVPGISSFMEIDLDKMSALTFQELTLDCFDVYRTLYKFNQRTTTATEHRNTYALIDEWHDTYAILKQQGRFKHDSSATDYPWQDGRKFKVGDIVHIAEGNTIIENVVITAVSTVTVDTNYKSQRIDFADPGVDFSEDAVVFSNTMIGKYINIILKLLEDSTFEQCVYKGFIKQPYSITDQKLTLVLEHFLAKYFKMNPRITSGSYKPTQRVSAAGAWESTIAWNDGSSGTLSDVTVFEGAIPGHWDITFSSASDYTVTGPNCEGKAGSTGADFYDQTDASDSQIYIAGGSAEDWTIECRCKITTWTHNLHADIKTGIGIIFTLGEIYTWGFDDVEDKLTVRKLTTDATPIEIHPYYDTNKEVDLKITKNGTTYKFYYKRPASVNFTLAGQVTEADDPTKTMIFCSTLDRTGTAGPSHVIMDFDYFRMSPKDSVVDEDFTSGIDAAFTSDIPEGTATISQTGGYGRIELPDDQLYRLDNANDEAPQLQRTLSLATAWGGTPAQNDTVGFDVAINFNDRTVAQIVYDILSEYVGLPDELIDVTAGGPSTTQTYSFDCLHVNFPDTFKMSFNQDTSALEKILNVLPHACAFVGSQMDGKIKLFSFHNAFYQVNKPFGANIEKIDLLEQTDLFNEIVVKYAWSPTANDYQYTFTYPLGAEDNETYRTFRKKRTIEVQCPFIFTAAAATKIAKRYYYTNRFGQTKLKATAFLDSIEADVGDVVNLNDYYLNTQIPNFEDGNIQCVITKKELTIGEQNRIVFYLTLFPYGEIGDF